MNDRKKKSIDYTPRSHPDRASKIMTLPAQPLTLSTKDEHADAPARMTPQFRASRRLSRSLAATGWRRRRLLPEVNSLRSRQRCRAWITFWKFLRCKWEISPKHRFSLRAIENKPDSKFDHFIYDGVRCHDFPLKNYLQTEIPTQKLSSKRKAIV